MSKKLLLIVTKESTDKKELEVDQLFIDAISNIVELPTKGAVDWIIFNQGTETVLLYDNVPLPGNTSFTPPKSSPLPFARNVKIRWQSDFQATRSIANAQAPSQTA